MIDSHCHLDFEAFDDRRERLLDECQRNNIQAIVIPGVSPAQWSRVASLCQDYRDHDCRLYASAGLHPWWIAQNTMPIKEFTDKLSVQARDCVAIGECGLDTLIDVSLADEVPWFEAQLKLACDLQLPLILHVRKAHYLMLELLKKYRPCAGGVIHGFSGSLEQAKEYWQLGFYLGVGGTITYERAKKTRAAVTQMPIESLLLETDAPDMPLSGFQGMANTPLHLTEVAQCLATLKSEPLDIVDEITAANTRRLFNL